MARWGPDAVGRLQDAAMTLFRESGYDRVTVADIATRAGLTRRTFFRYFSDKREVLFFGTESLESLVTARIAGAHAGTSAIDAVALSLTPIAELNDDNPEHADFARRRHVVIRANAELRERELSKHASLASVIALALEARGVRTSAARLAAQSVLAAFTVGFERWFDDPKKGTMTSHLRNAIRELRTVAQGSTVLDKNVSR